MIYVHAGSTLQFSRTVTNVSVQHTSPSMNPPTFEDTLDQLCQADLPSSPMSIQSPTAMDFDKILSALSNVPLTPSPIRSSRLSASNVSMSPPLSPYDYPMRSRSSPGNIESLEATFHKIIRDFEDVNLSPMASTDRVQASPVPDPFEMLVRQCSQRYQAIHGDSDEESTSDSSADSEFEPELDRESIQIPSADQNELQAEMPVSREHIAS